MPRIVHVARAQQRYATVPVLDENGEPKRTPVMSNGIQKTTKTGRPVTMAVTVSDKTKPLPLAQCDFAQCADKTIALGTPYQRMAIKTGPSTSRTLTRHAGCPSWNTWDYSNSMAAQIERIVHEAHEAIAAATEQGEVQSAMEVASEQIREISEQKQEAAESMEEGLGQSTASSESLAEQAAQLDEWATDLSDADIPDKTECPECGGDGDVECGVCSGDGTEDCVACDGSGKVDDEDCVDCDGSGNLDCSECGGTTTTDCEVCDDGYDMDTWRDEVDSAVGVLDECPV